MFKGLVPIDKEHIVWLLSILGLLVYGSAIPYPFVHDDIVFIQQNPHITDLKNISSALLAPQETTTSLRLNPYWRPVLEIFYRLEYVVFGFQSWGYHLVNVIVHILNSILVFRLLMLLSRKFILAVSVAIIFLIHPVQTEAVACIAGVSNLLFCFFSLLCLLFYICITETTIPPSCLGRLFASGLFYFLALLAKEQALTVPLILLGYEGLLNRDTQERWSTKLLRLSPFFIITVGYFMLRQIILGKMLIDILAYPYEFLLRLKAIPHVLVTYGRILLWPSDLHYFRSYDVLEPMNLSVFWLFLFFIIAMVGVIKINRLNRNFLIFATLWFFIFLLPTSNVIPLIIEYSKVFMAEHFLYLPMIGFFIFLLTALDFFFKIFADLKRQRFFLLVFMIVCSFWIGIAWRQNTYWRGEVPLFERTIRFEKNIGRVHMLLGRAYYFERNYEQAIQQYQQALTVIQGYLQKITDSSAREFYLGNVKGIHFDLAHCFEDQGHLMIAIHHYQEALKVDPGDGVLYNNLAGVYMKLNQTTAAKALLEKAIMLNPKDTKTLNNLAISYIQAGETQKGRELLEKILIFDPNFTPAQQNLKHLLGEP